MKLPITDKFLWDLYKYLEKADDVVDFLLSNKYRQSSILTRGANPIMSKYRRDMGKQAFSKLIYRLKKSNFIKAENLKSKQGIIITKEGFNKILKASFMMELKNKRSDGKWIMLTFDIPVKHKKARTLLRSVLLNLGYKMFQQSIWVCPYNISEKTEKLLQLYSLDKYVKIFLIEEIKQAR